MKNAELGKYAGLIKEYCENNYKNCLRQAKGKLKYPFIVPGASYAYELWDWDSWLTGIALEAISKSDDCIEYEKGCVLNFIDHMDKYGRIPINVSLKSDRFDLKEGVETNIHKPCLVQHALFISETTGSAEWIADDIGALEKFVGWYENNVRHESGLYFWIDDFAIGVDNDPCTFFRPKKTSASVYLNFLMYAELKAASKLEDMLKRKDKSAEYAKKAEDLGAAIRRECWDERDRFYYSADIGLLPIDPEQWLHSGAPRHWSTLIMRIGVWTGFMALWCGLATKEEAERIVKENLLDEKSFRAPCGVRTLSKYEKQYVVKKSGNPSCWLGPVWGISNYMTFEGLVGYGYIKEARELAEKTVMTFGKDIENCGEMHEYYDPETGVGVNNQGFQSWNLLAYKMCEWLEKNDEDRV